MERLAGQSVTCFSECVSPFPEGKATAVGGEPGITKAVLTRIQVPSPQHIQLGGCWPLPPCLLWRELWKTSRQAEVIPKGCLGPPSSKDLMPRSLALSESAVLITELCIPTALAPPIPGVREAPDVPGGHAWCAAPKAGGHGDGHEAGAVW